MSEPALNQSSLTDLFSKDPLKLTNEDVNAIVLAFRSQRERWGLEESKAKATGKRAKVVGLSLDTLELDLGPK